MVVLTAFFFSLYWMVIFLEFCMLQDTWYSCLPISNEICHKAICGELWFHWSQWMFWYKIRLSSDKCWTYCGSAWRLHQEMARPFYVNTRNGKVVPAPKSLWSESALIYFSWSLQLLGQIHLSAPVTQCGCKSSLTGQGNHIVSLEQRWRTSHKDCIECNKCLPDCGKWGWWLLLYSQHISHCSIQVLL